MPIWTIRTFIARDISLKRPITQDACVTRAIQCQYPKRLEINQSCKLQCRCLFVIAGIRFQQGKFNSRFARQLSILFILRKLNEYEEDNPVSEMVFEDNIYQCFSKNIPKYFNIIFHAAQCLSIVE